MEPRHTSPPTDHSLASVPSQADKPQVIQAGVGDPAEGSGVRRNGRRAVSHVVERTKLFGCSLRWPMTVVVFSDWKVAILVIGFPP